MCCTPLARVPAAAACNKACGIRVHQRACTSGERTKQLRMGACRHAGRSFVGGECRLPAVIKHRMTKHCSQAAQTLADSQQRLGLALCVVGCLVHACIVSAGTDGQNPKPTHGWQSFATTRDCKRHLHTAQATRALLIPAGFHLQPGQQVGLVATGRPFKANDTYSRMQPQHRHGHQQTAGRLTLARCCCWSAEQTQQHMCDCCTCSSRLQFLPAAAHCPSIPPFTHASTYTRNVVLIGGRPRSLRAAVWCRFARLRTRQKVRTASHINDSNRRAGS